LSRYFYLFLMPRTSLTKRNLRRSRKASGGVNGSDPVTKDHDRNLQVISVNSTTFVGILGVQPDVLGTRASALAQCYGLYRLRRLRITLYPISSTYSFAVIIGPTDLTASTALTDSDVIGAPFSVLVPAVLTVPQRIIVPWSALRKSLQPWFICEAGSNPPSSEIQVTFVVHAATDIVTLPVLIEYDIDFSDPISANLIPRPLSVSRRVDALEASLASLSVRDSKSPKRLGHV